MMKQALTITRKELRSYFGSPMALIFVGSFLAAVLFSFFWLDTFFARGIADVRSLFLRMPVLLIFLVAALTMRQWSEEQRSGTLEVLLTLPVSTTQLVLGKFLAVLSLVGVALALTIFLPLTAAVLGNLDWGPVAGGYLAALLLAGAYTAIGLFISSRTDNQIVALIVTVLLCLIFYMVGSPGVTDFFATQAGEILRAIGAGSRFESIQRGVIDLRDLLYYIALAGIFLTLNVISLKARGWSSGERTRPLRRRQALTCALLALNLLVVNVWIYPLRRLRLDLTQYHDYTLSSTTRNLLGNLQEPLVIRGYFSEKTHPKLAPLVPNVRDMLQEYALASGGKVQLEILDPAQDPDKEVEATQVYGIRPTPFQVQDRYEASVINSYFDILIQYGDQSIVLGFSDLIEVEASANGGVDVRLRNLEYDLTSSIKKVVYGFQSVDAVLAALSDPVEMTVYITPDTLPEWLLETPATIETVVQDIAGRSGGKFNYTFVDPSAPDSPVTPQELYDLYGLEPLAVSLFSQESYYLYMVMSFGEQSSVVYPSGELTEGDVRNAIESALKRTAPGFLQVVGLWIPPAVPTQDMFGQTQDPLSTWYEVEAALRQEYEVRTLDLSSGYVDVDVDVLVVVAPQNLDALGLYAIDQYLMRGGTVMLASGNYTIALDPTGSSLMLQPIAGGVQELLDHYGVTVAPTLVMDPQNEPFPSVETREVNGFQMQDIREVDYPFFVDVRANAMADDNPIVANLPAVTLNWASPISLDAVKNAGREVQALMSSSPDAWLKYDTNIQPDPLTGDFPIIGEQSTYTLAVSLQGTFESYFKDKASPFESVSVEGEGSEPAARALPGTIESSPKSARLVVIGSSEFLDDLVFNFSSALGTDSYLNSLKLVQNTVAWATEDLDMLEIRTRGTSARILADLTSQEQSFWEIANYVVAVVLVLGLAGVSMMMLRSETPLLSPVAPSAGDTDRGSSLPASDVGSEEAATLDQEVE